MMSVDEPQLLARRKRGLLVISWTVPILVVVAIVIFWNDPPVLSAIGTAILLLTMTALYLVERTFSKALIEALKRTKA